MGGRDHIGEGVLIKHIANIMELHKFDFAQLKLHLLTATAWHLTVGLRWSRALISINKAPHMKQLGARCTKLLHMQCKVAGVVDNRGGNMQPHG